MVHVNGKKVGGNANISKFTAYVSPYFVVSNGGAYTKHIYAASQRIASKLGNEDGFGADPRRVEQAGGKKISDIQKDNIGARFSELGFTYTAPEKEKVEKDSTMDSEEEEKLIFFYHPDHLGSTSYVTDADGNIAQHVEYIPYGEVFVEERNHSFSTNFLFNAKELDNETGLYYYGARYLDPTGTMWLSVDPMWEKYMGISPYAYCLGNPLKMIDPTGREVEDVDDLIKNFERVNGKISTCGSETKLREDSYSSVNASSVGFTSCTYYTGNIPVGDKYRNAGYGGCTEATLCSVLDMFKIDEHTYRRNILDADRITEGQRGNVYLRYNKLGVRQQHGLECEVIKDPKCYSDNIKSMKYEGNVFAMTYTISYMENGLTKTYDHNVVVTGIDGEMVQFWDNAKGCYSKTYINSIKELYKFSKSGTNPWNPVSYDISSLPERYIYNYNK